MKNGNLRPAEQIKFLNDTRKHNRCVAPEELDRPDKPEEACGVFGVVAPGREVSRLAFFASFALQHPGQ